LECDLFVTHGWLEGIFEFSSKVLHSWPAGCNHAYVCFLSNPQNLDISDLIKSPRESPFAKALEKSISMLVVPNRTASIYSRIWCAYEAFLGCVTQKTIVQSSRPVLKAFAVGALPWILLCFGLGFASGWLTFGSSNGEKKLANLLLAAVLIPLVMVLLFVGVRCGFVFNHILNLVGLTATGYATAADILLLSKDIISLTDQNSYPVLVFCGVLLLPFFLLQEWDRVYMVEMHLESEMLNHGFTGRIEDAQASFASDKEGIMTEIGDRSDEVDECLEVLLAAGMSDHLLQDAHKHGVAVDDVGLHSLSNLYLGFAMWCWILYYVSTNMPDERTFMLWSRSVAVSWALVYLFVDGHVRRVFARRCMIRLVPVCSVLLCAPVVLVTQYLSHSDLYNMMLVVDGLGFIAVLSSVLNLDGLMRIPCAGPWFAALMLGCTCNCSGRYHGHLTEELSDSSEDDDCGLLS